MENRKRSNIDVGIQKRFKRRAVRIVNGIKFIPRFGSVVFDVDDEFYIQKGSRCINVVRRQDGQKCNGKTNKDSKNEGDKR